MSQYLEIVEDLKELGYDFRINDLNELLEISIKGKWQPMTDILKAVIRTELRDKGYGKKKKPSLASVEDGYKMLAHVQRYNPILDYFRGLDGKYAPGTNGPYAITQFSQHFTNPDGQFQTALFRFMVGAVAKAHSGERNPMLVMVGEQYTGKSWFVEWLCPVKAYFLRDSINPDDKDSHIRLTDTFFWEVEELGATTRRADIEALKAFITRPAVKKRPAYGEHPINKPATCSFIGTVNNDGAGFLNDPTGSTRFLACEISAIDFSYTQTNVDYLWAEAYWYYRNVPKSWQLSPDERTRQAQINAKFEITSALADVIDHLYEFTNDPADFVPTQDIKNLVSCHYRISSDQAFYNELGRTLTRAGLTKKRQPFQPGRPHGMGWIGIKRRIVEEKENATK